MTTDPHETAKAELAEAMIPTPEDVISDLSPLAALYYLEQLGWATFTMFTAYAESEQGKDQAADDDLAVTLTQIGVVVGMLDETCIRVGLLPLEARQP